MTVLRSCAVHGRNFWAAYDGRSFGGRFFCPGYLRDDLFAGFDPQPYAPPVLGRPEGQHTVRLVDAGWPTLDTPMCVLERRGDLLVVRPVGMPGGPVREVPLGRVLAGSVRAAEPEPVLVMTERPGCGAAVALWCLAWIVVGLPVAACVIGWVFR